MSTMKKIKEGVVVHCTFCKAQGLGKVQSVWRITRNPATACNDHKDQLEQLRIKLDAREDNHYTEADYQTWMKL